MKICIVSTGHPKRDYIPPELGGGLQSILWGISKELVKKGYEVHILTKKQNKQGDFETIGGIQIHRINTHTNNIPLSILIFSCLAYKRIRSLNPDIIQSYGRVPTFLLSKLKKPLILAQQNWDILAAPPLNIKAKLFFPVRNLVEIGALRGAAKIITPEYFKKVLITKGQVSEDKVIPVPNGVDIVKFNPKNDPTPAKEKYSLQGKTILFAGRLEPEKGLEQLIRAMPEIIEKHKDAELIIAGNGYLKNKLKSFSRKLGVEDNVKFLGWVPKKDLASLYTAAEIFILPSFYEVFPMAMLEALASGTPVITTNVAGMPDVITDGENGVLIEPGSSSEITDAVLKLLGDNELRRRMGMAGRKNVEEHFTWDNVTEIITQVYEGMAC